MTNNLIKQEYQQSCLKSLFCKFKVDTMTLLANTIYHWMKCWLTFFTPIVSPLFIHWIDHGFFRYFLIMARSTVRVWHFGRGCSLFHGTWSHLWCFRAVRSYCFIEFWSWTQFFISICFMLKTLNLPFKL